MNCLNGSLLNSGAGTRGEAKLAAGRTKPRARSIDASEIKVAPELADGRAGVVKFALEEVKLLD